MIALLAHRDPKPDTHRRREGRLRQRHLRRRQQRREELRERRVQRRLRHEMRAPEPLLDLCGTPLEDAS